MGIDRRYFGETRTRAQAARLDEVGAIIRIQEILSGSIWSPETIDEIAQVVIEAGYPVSEPEDS